MSNASISDYKARLGRLILKKAYKEGNFVLASGQSSDYYIEGKMVTLDPEGIFLVGNLILEMLDGVDFDAIGGPTIGADPIATAVAFASHLKNPQKSVPAFIVRKKKKEHGAQKMIEGPLPRGSRVVVVEDVITTGGSLLDAIHALEEHGCWIVKVITVVDREGNLVEEVKKYDLLSIFTISELKKMARENT